MSHTHTNGSHSDEPCFSYSIRTCLKSSITHRMNYDHSLRVVFHPIMVLENDYFAYANFNLKNNDTQWQLFKRETKTSTGL